MHGICESGAHIMSTLFSKEVFKCVREQMMKPADPHAMWCHHKCVGILSFSEMF